MEIFPPCLSIQYLGSTAYCVDTCSFSEKTSEFEPAGRSYGYNTMYSHGVLISL